MTTAVEGIAADTRVSAADTRTRLGQSHSAHPTAQIIALPDLHPNAEGDGLQTSTGAGVLKNWNPLHQIKAKLQVVVGEASISVGELLAAKEHQVLRLDREIDQAVDLTIEGKVVARGQLVAVDGHFAVRITELPVALGLTAGN